jgi:hypothetical protein
MPALFIFLGLVFLMWVWFISEKYVYVVMGSCLFGFWGSLSYLFEPFFYVNVTIKIQLRYHNSVLNWVDLITSISIFISVKILIK